nr:MAG TPA: hypothetical protein [Caudoviricetes sp.]
MCGRFVDSHVDSSGRAVIGFVDSLTVCARTHARK